MSFNYSDHNNTITIKLGIIPKKEDSIFDISADYYKFRKMYKDFLKIFYGVSIEEEVYKKTFIELVSRLKESDGSTLLLNDCEDIISDIFYSNTLYVNIVFEYEDTLFVNLEPFLETFQTKYEHYNFIDFVVYKTKIKVLGTKPRSNNERRRY